MTTPTLTRLAELKALADAATPGLWRSGQKEAAVLNGGIEQIPSVIGEKNGRLIHIEEKNVTFRTYHLSREDADFIATSRTAMPQLVDTVRAYHEQINLLLNKVNAVTSLWRHGHRVGEQAMVDLCNRQIDVEQTLNRIAELLEVKE